MGSRVLMGLQNVLYTAHTIEESAEKFDRAPKDVQESLVKCLTRLREYRDKERPRPHLDDKIVTSWNGLMVGDFTHKCSLRWR